MQGKLSPEQIDQFIEDGFIRINHAFSADTAAEIRNILWTETGMSPDDPQTWKQPVVRLGYYTAEPFVAAAKTEILKNAFDQLVGPDNWVPCRSMGAMVLRFPSREMPQDTGWHVDASFPGADPYDYMSYRCNIFSKGRGLLMLFLFSDVGENDAPTRIRAGSHRDIAQLLHPKGEKGMAFLEIATAIDELPEHKEVLATGNAGTVYLCHPFLVHAAQPHTGHTPRFMAQPPLVLKKDLVLRSDSNGYKYTPVETAVRNCLPEQPAPSKDLF